MSTKTNESVEDVTKQDRRERLQALPPSAKLVAKVLQVEGTMSLEEVAEESLLPDRTARYALNRLTDADIVLVRHDPYDARRRLYTLAE
ncbi:MAG: DNA-binding MarR family transcriptional regulator [Salinirussus sp.]|jgi:DNA-binding MarR family transcriptional regulator